MLATNPVYNGRRAVEDSAGESSSIHEEGKTMKAKPIGILILGVALIYSTCAWAGEPSMSQEPRLITVTGDAEVRVVPDEVILTLGVETWDKDLGVAKTQNDDIVRRVLGLVLESGVEPEHVQTDYISIHRVLCAKDDRHQAQGPFQVRQPAD
jgi:uncharacterized protein YggE